MGADDGAADRAEGEGTADASEREVSADVEAAKQDLRVLYRVIRDSRSPWYVSVLVALLVLWAVSPLDPLPDAIPVVGVVDEAVLFLAVRAAVYRLVPDEHVEEHARRVAAAGKRRLLPRHLVAAGVVVQLVVLAAVFLVFGLSFVTLLERIEVAL